MEVGFGVSIIPRKEYRDSIRLLLYPPYVSQIINRFMFEFDTIEKVDKAIKKIKDAIDLDKQYNIGNNDYSISLSKEFVTFDLLWDKSDDPLEEFYPLEVPSDDFLDLLYKLKNFIEQFESCQIPGVIPASKLDTWTCVPKEYVKLEWWEHQKDQKNGA